MADDFSGSSLASAALRLQRGRIRILAENIANARSTAETPGGDPYQRKVAVFAPITDPSQPPPLRVSRDKTPFPKVQSPGHPAADVHGNVAIPNVHIETEAADLRSAIRAYEANLRTISVDDEVTRKTIDLLKS